VDPREARQPTGGVLRPEQTTVGRRRCGGRGEQGRRASGPATAARPGEAGSSTEVGAYNGGRWEPATAVQVGTGGGGCGRGREPAGRGRRRGAGRGAPAGEMGRDGEGGAHQNFPQFATF
jgi:hypothetical protein